MYGIMGNVDNGSNCIVHFKNSFKDMFSWCNIHVFIYAFIIASWEMYCIMGNVDNVVVKQIFKDIFLRVRLRMQHCMVGSMDNMVVVIIYVYMSLS